MKGWTVTTRSTKNGASGLAGREFYFFNKNDKNHKSTEEIISIHGNDKHIENMALAGAKYAAKQKLARKGGRPPSSYAVEFVLTLPKGPRPTPKQWHKVLISSLKQLAKHCDVDLKELAPITRAVLHRQAQDGTGKGTGDHVHVLVGKFTNDGKYLRNLQRKTATRAIKDGYNAAMLEHVGLNWKTYKPAPQQYANKRKVPTWKVKAARAHNALDLKNKLLDQREFDIDEKTKQLKELQSLNAKFQNQAQKWLEAFDVADRKQMNRQANRMNKAISELKEYKEVEGFHEVSQNVKSFIDKINQVNKELKTPKTPVDKDQRPTQRPTPKP